MDTGTYKEEFQQLGVTTLLEKPVLTHELLQSVMKTVKAAGQPEKSAKFRPGAVHQLMQSSLEKQALIADDERVNIDVMEQILRREGYDCVTAVNGIEACEAFKSHIFDVIFMDISMPEMNGIEAAKEIRKIETLKGLPRTPIIGFTAHAMKDDKEKFLEEGLDDYMSKPVSVEIIRKKLSYWENRNRLEPPTHAFAS